MKADFKNTAIYFYKFWVEAYNNYHTHYFRTIFDHKAVTSVCRILYDMRVLTYRILRIKHAWMNGDFLLENKKKTKNRRFHPNGDADRKEVS